MDLGEDKKVSEMSVWEPSRRHPVIALAIATLMVSPLIWHYVLWPAIGEAGVYGPSVKRLDLHSENRTVSEQTLQDRTLHRKPMNPTELAGDQLRRENLPEITRCSDVRLPDRGLGEADLTVDEWRQLLTIHLGDKRGGSYHDVAYTVRYATDPSCADSSAMAELIGRTVPAR